MLRRSCASLAPGFLLLLAVSLRAEDLSPDLAALRAAREPTDGPGLLAFFKRRTISEAVRERIAGMIQRLGDDDYATREKATRDLVDLGGVCRAQVARALESAGDLEVRKRARVVLDRIGPAKAEAQLFGPAARVLANRKPEGAAKALLDFLPGVEEPDVADEVARALAPLAAGKGGKPDPEVLAAMGDRAAVKRAAAGCAVARLGTAEARGPALELLKDGDAGVRRRVALALLEARDKAAIPALIALLTAPSADDAAAAEEALSVVAGETAPRGPAGDGGRAREACRRGWEGWWKEQEGKLDLAKVDLNAVGRGYTLVTTVSPGGRASSGAVMELDAAGKVRWKIDHLHDPVHAVMTRRDRVLICESNGGRVTERDLKGNVLWQKPFRNQVLSAERLPDGHTFLVTRSQLLEVDAAGNAAHTVDRIGDALLAGHRHKDGTFTVLTMGGSCVTLSRAGAQVRSFPVGYLSGGPGGVKPYFLPGGGLVLPDYNHGEVREYDAFGRLVHRFPAYRPTTVVKLANGNYLVASRMRTRVYEVEKSGREVSSRETDGRVLFVDRK